MTYKCLLVMAQANYVQGIPGLDITSISDLRNGGLAIIRQPARAAAIGAQFFWTGVGGATPDRSPGLVGLWIRSAFGTIAAADFAAAVAAAHTADPAAPTLAGDRLQGRAGLYDASLVVAEQSNANRFRAIALGATRCGLTASWRILPAELEGSETAAATVFTTDANGGNVRLTSTRIPTANNLSVAEALALWMPALTPEELDFAYLCLRLAAAAAPLAGLSLLETNHHYLSSRLQATRATEKQLLGDVSADAVAFWRSAEDTARDMVWHKASHPVGTRLLKLLALDVNVPKRLNLSGLGSAAVRLPFCESELKRAGAYLALIDSCAPLLAVANYTVKLPVLRAAVAYVKAYPHAIQHAAGAGLPPADPQRPTVRSRAAAIEDVLLPALDKAASIVAWLSGLYTGLAEQADMNISQDTLMRAYSVRKAKAGHVASAALGKQAYEAYRRYAMNQADKGTLVGVDLTDDEGTQTVQTQQVAAAQATPAAGAVVAPTQNPAGGQPPAGSAPAAGSSGAAASGAGANP